MTQIEIFDAYLLQVDKSHNSEVNHAQSVGVNMLTHEVSITCRPQSTVTNLTVTQDGDTLVWSENNGSVNFVSDKEKPVKISIESNIQSLISLDGHIIVGDDEFGVRCFDKYGNTVWECQIPGGISFLVNCAKFIALADNLGRLRLVTHDGKLNTNKFEYTSIINLKPYLDAVIVVQEGGIVSLFDGEQELWNRPKRGDVGESITGLGVSADDKLIVGREGFALVPGEEEALEIEVWDVNNNRLEMRKEVKNRLLITSSNSKQTYLAFDDGSVNRLISSDNQFYELSEPLHNCEFPVKTLIVTDDCIIAGSWFYLHGITIRGEKWMVEHQGIVQFTAYSSMTNMLYFAGDDQNDYTEIEPIGKINLHSGLVDRDKSELTTWFEVSEVTETLSTEDIYSIDEKLSSIIEADMQSAHEFGDEDITSLLSALEEQPINHLDDNKQSDLSENNLMGELLEEFSVEDRPIADAGEDNTFECGEKSHSIVVLDSINTKGDKSKIVSYSWIDDSGREISNLPKFRAKLSRGKHRFELRIIDNDGNSTSDTVYIEVI